jgi:hypothetical protein
MEATPFLLWHSRLCKPGFGQRMKSEPPVEALGRDLFQHVRYRRRFSICPAGSGDAATSVRVALVSRDEPCGPRGRVTAQ